MTKHPPVTRSIDVGYGNTKFTTSPMNSHFKCGVEVFPSIVPLATKSMKISGGMLSTFEYIELGVDGGSYIVGKDAEYHADASTTRILDNEYSLTAQYMALVRGALYYMREPRIDVLVLGLPITTYESHRERLRDRIVGSHTVPNWLRKQNPAAPENVIVQVCNVKVLPQPVGAFFNHTVPRNIYEKMRDEINLTIDVGHGTLDWFLAQGSAMKKARCGGHPSGVSRTLSAIAAAMRVSVGNLGVTSKLDHALQHSTPVKIAGKIYNLEEFESVIRTSIRSSLARMSESLGTFDDVDNILLTGGGARLFLDELQRIIPSREIIVDNDSIYSNVRGFQMAGEQWAEELGPGR